MLKTSLIISNVLALIGLLITAFSGYFDPRSYGIISLAGYVFPVMFIATLVLAIISAFVNWKIFAIPAAGLVLTFSQAMLYCPISIGSKHTSNSLKVISYNVYYWGYGDGSNKDLEPMRDKMGRANIVGYLSDSKADILCLQEASWRNELQEEIEDELYDKYKYHEATKDSNGVTSSWIFSKYRIIKSEEIKSGVKENRIGAYWLDIKGKETIVINAHLQISGLSIEQRNEFSDIVHANSETDMIKATSKGIVSTLLDTSKLRAQQADAIAAFIRLHEDTPIIVCGDFNDIPQSYTHHTIAADLKDCYKSGGLGPGFSFHKYGMRVRIDNILCSQHFTTQNCYVDDNITDSDHYPIVAIMEMKQ